MSQTEVPTPDSGALITAARDLAPLVRSRRDETETLGCTPPLVVRALSEAGLFRMWMPHALGGFEADPATYFGVIEEIAAADGATGWNLMNGACCGLMSVYLPANVGRMIYCEPDAIVAGQIAPNGQAIAADGGYRVGGRWSFASGIHHATWVVSGCTVFDGGAPRMTEGGAPHRIHVMTPPDDVQIDHDSWHVRGLRGTGSCDYAIGDVFVPAERAFSFFVSRAYHPGPLALFPRSMFSMSIGAVALGIARGAIDAFIELAGVRKASGTNALLRERQEVQAAVAQAEALTGAARAYMLQTSGDVWRECLAGDPPSLETRLRLRAASVVVPQMSAQAVDLIWKAAGAASIREAHVIERCFRDVHAATQHLGVGEPVLIDAGRAFLGLESQIVPV
jgi:alkylation response protein AidB-like acyl-CoA dehydrogenase